MSTVMFMRVFECYTVMHMTDETRKTSSIKFPRDHLSAWPVWSMACQSLKFGYFCFTPSQSNPNQSLFTPDLPKSCRGNIDTSLSTSTPLGFFISEAAVGYTNVSAVRGAIKCGFSTLVKLSSSNKSHFTHCNAFLAPVGTALEFVITMLRGTRGKICSEANSMLQLTPEYPETNRCQAG